MTKHKRMKLDEPLVDKCKQALVAEFLSDNEIPRYILGRNEYAEKLAALVDVDAFIDDFSTEREYLGKPVVRSCEADKQAIVVSCSLAIYPHSAMKALEKSGMEHVIHYLDVSNYSRSKSLGMTFLDKARSDIDVNYECYEYLYNRLGDTDSKKVLIDLLNFRKTQNLSYLNSCKVDLKGQYFEDFLNLVPGEVFIDAGGFDGNTSIEFIKHCPEYKSIYIFEPSETNLQKAESNLNNFTDIHFFSKGLSDKRDQMSFDPLSGSASSILEKGSATVMVDALDELVKESVTFVKMDIEGSEARAIAGMSRHILHDHPRLAISVYHKPDDLWKIPRQVMTLRNDYDIYLRHYTEGTDETVMFFMPIEIDKFFA